MDAPSQGSFEDVTLASLMRTALPSPMSIAARTRRLVDDPMRLIRRLVAPKMVRQNADQRDYARVLRYAEARQFWQLKAVRAELFGPPQLGPLPPRQIPHEMLDRFTMGGKVAIEYNYLDATYPSNYPLIYTDAEIDHYVGVISNNLALPNEQRDWFIYGTLDEWVCDAIKKYPVKASTVVNMGSLTPWYESMLIYFGAKPTTIDYNPITLRTDRMSFMTIADWERCRPIFDMGFSISSFEHDGLGMYGDPLDPDGDLRAMRKMKERVKAGGLLFLAVPTGKDKILFNNARVYGRHRLPLLLSGWEIVDTSGFHVDDLDGGGQSQPLYILRNR